MQLGAIYALERLAHDSPGDQSTIAEVLTAFVRHRAQLGAEQEGVSGTDTVEPEGGGPLGPPVQAALDVLGRMPRPVHVRLKLTEVLLPRAHLARANLSGANLGAAVLGHVILEDADLTDAKFNTHTRWPEGFDPIAAGAINLEADTGEGDA